MPQNRKEGRKQALNKSVLIPFNAVTESFHMIIFIYIVLCVEPSCVVTKVTYKLDSSADNLDNNLSDRYTTCQHS